MKKHFLLLLFAFFFMQHILSAQVLDNNMWITNEDVFSIVLDGNYSYIGGDFSYVGPYTGYGAKLTSTNTFPDMGYPLVKDMNVTNKCIYTVVPDGNGGWYIGGAFTKVGTYTRNNIVHIKADKTVDETWNPNIGSIDFPRPYVCSIAISGNDIYVGGFFTSVGGIRRNYIAKLNNTNGSADPTWNPNADNLVSSIAVNGSNIYVGGDFINIGGRSRIHIAKLNNATGSADPIWNPNPDFSVYSIAVSGSDIYAGGVFTNIGGQTRNGIAKLNNTNGSADLIWNPNPNNDVNTILISGSDIYVGGSFTSIGGQTRNNIAKLNITNGSADVNWNPNAIGGSVPKVNSIAISGNDIYVGGSFSSIGGQARLNIAKLDNINGSADINWNSNAGYNVYSIATNGNDIYVGGEFTSIGGLIRNGIARINNTTGMADESWNPNAFENSSIITIAINGSDIYVGGNFSSIGGLARIGVAKLNKTNGNADVTWNPNSNAFIETIAISGSDIYVGGGFSYIGGKMRNYIAKLNMTTGSADVNWNPNANSLVRSIAISGSDIYVGGVFTNVGGQNRNYIAKLNNTTGTANTTWNPNANENIRRIAINGNDIYVGGGFSNIGGKTRNHIAKLNNTTGTSDASWNPNANDYVNSIAINGSDIYVGGYFTNIGGLSRNYVSKLNNTTGSADISWNCNAYPNGWLNSNVYSIAINNNEIYIGGFFSSIGGEERWCFVKFNQSGVSIKDEKKIKVGNIEIYPNPAIDKFTIDIKDFKTQNAEFEICNIKGQEILKKQITADQTEIDITNWKSGIYFVKIITDNCCEVKKIVKE